MAQDKDFGEYLRSQLIFQEPRGNNLPRNTKVFYNCRACDEKFEHSLEAAEEHISRKRHSVNRKEYKSLSSLRNIPPLPLNAENILEKSLTDVVTHHGLNAHDLKIRNAICMRLKELLKDLDCEVRLIGSSLTGLGFKDSDVNIDLLLQREVEKNLPKILLKALKAIEDSDSFHDVETQLEQKVPKLIFKDSESGLTCSLSSATSTAWKTSKLIEAYVSLDERVHPLAICLRYWARVCQIDRQREGTLPSYAWVLLVINFLQHCKVPVLPIIHEYCTRKVNELSDDEIDKVEEKVDNLLFFNGSFILPENVKAWKSANKDSIGKLWVDLFRYYVIDFKIEDFVVNVRHYRKMSRQSKNWSRKRIAVEDPFSRNRNVARGLNSHAVFSYVQNRMKDALRYFGKPNKSKKDKNSRPSIGEVIESLDLSGIDNIRDVKNETKCKDTSEKEDVMTHLKPETMLDVSATKGADSCVSENLEDVLEANVKLDETQKSDELTNVESLTLQMLRLSSDKKESVSTLLSINPEQTDTQVCTTLPTTTDVSNLAISSEEPIAADQKENQSTKYSIESTDIPELKKHLNENTKFPELLFPQPKFDNLIELLDNEKDTSVEMHRKISEDPDVVFEDSVDMEQSITVISEESDGGNNECIFVASGDIDGGVNEHEFGSDADMAETAEHDVEIEPKILANDFDQNSKPSESTYSSDNMKLYIFNEYNLTRGIKVPQYCTGCNREGHLIYKCSEEAVELIELPKMTESFSKLLDNVCKRVLEDFISPKDELMQRQHITAQLESYIRKKFGDRIQLSLFGSSVNGFGSRSSDLDICMTFQDMTDPDRINYAGWIDRLAKHLVSHPELTKILAIRTAKVPIVKFYHKAFKLEGDISLYNTLALRNTKLLKTYANMDSRVQILGYTVKIFAKICEIGDASRGTLSSYGYILMLLHYLQQRSPPVIPVLQELYEGDEKPEYIVGEWNTWFYEDVASLEKKWPDYGKNKESVGELWLGFLRYFLEDFNFERDVVCCRQKKKLLKFEKQWTGAKIAIEDPFNLSHNLGAGITRRMFHYIMLAFASGRERFGTPISMQEIHMRYPNPQEYFFDQWYLTKSMPMPTDGLCRRCGKIGHVAGQCREMEVKKDGKKRQQNTQRTKDSEFVQPDSFCFNCAKVGHVEQNCPGRVTYEKEFKKDGSHNRKGNSELRRPEANSKSRQSQGKKSKESNSSKKGLTESKGTSSNKEISHASQQRESKTIERSSLEDESNQGHVAMEIVESVLSDSDSELNLSASYQKKLEKVKTSSTGAALSRLSKMKCFHCNELGHQKRDCPSLKARAQSNPESTTDKNASPYSSISKPLAVVTPQMIPIGKEPFRIPPQPSRTISDQVGVPLLPDKSAPYPIGVTLNRPPLLPTPPDVNTPIRGLYTDFGVLEHSPEVSEDSKVGDSSNVNSFRTEDDELVRSQSTGVPRKTMNFEEFVEQYQQNNDTPSEQHVTSTSIIQQLSPFPSNNHHHPMRQTPPDSYVPTFHSDSPYGNPIKYPRTSGNSPASLFQQQQFLLQGTSPSDYPNLFAMSPEYQFMSPMHPSSSPAFLDPSLMQQNAAINIRSYQTKRFYPGEEGRPSVKPRSRTLSEGLEIYEYGASPQSHSHLPSCLHGSPKSPHGVNVIPDVPGTSGKDPNHALLAYMSQGEGRFFGKSRSRTLSGGSVGSLRAVSGADFVTKSADYSERIMSDSGKLPIARTQSDDSGTRKVASEDSKGSKTTKNRSQLSQASSVSQDEGKLKTRGGKNKSGGKNNRAKLHATTNLGEDTEWPGRKDLADSSVKSKPKSNAYQSHQSRPLSGNQDSKKPKTGNMMDRSNPSGSGPSQPPGPSKSQHHRKPKSRHLSEGSTSEQPGSVRQEAEKSGRSKPKPRRPRSQSVRDRFPNESAKTGKAKTKATK